MTIRFRFVKHIDKLSQVCKINQIHNILEDVMKMKLCPAALRAGDWFLKLGKEFTSWTEMEKEFLRKTKLHIPCTFSLSLARFYFFFLPHACQKTTLHIPCAFSLSLSLSLFIIGTL